MTDLDARVAALMALANKSWSQREFEQALRAELQRSALHEPVTGKELQAFLDASGLSYFDLAKVEDGLESFLQGRAKPAQKEITDERPRLTDQLILDAAEKAGLWPNTVHHWLPAFHRYHAELDAVVRASKGEKT